MSQIRCLTSSKTHTINHLKQLFTDTPVFDAFSNVN